MPCCCAVLSSHPLYQILLISVVITSCLLVGSVRLLAREGSWPGREVVEGPRLQHAYAPVCRLGAAVRRVTAAAAAFSA